MIGRSISHYRILEELGRGGMGVVYKAEDTKLHRNVALKFPPQGLFIQGSARERFLREARALATVNHPNVAHIYGVDEHEGELFIVMELVEGVTLHQALESRGSLPLPVALQYALQIAEGLQAIHARGVIHRDIKSSNVLVDTSGRIKITDFGVALMPGKTRVTQEGTTVGTVAYMSPEQARGEEVDLRTDIWSFGVILYEMLSGRLPFASSYDQAAIYSILHEQPSALGSVRPDIPEGVVRIVDTSLAKNPKHRYHDAASILRDLRAVTAAELGSTLQATRTVEAVSIKRFIPAAALLLVLIVAGVLWLQLQKKTDDRNQLSIAVLPFENLGDSSNAYAAAGIADAIADELGTIPGFTVISSRSASRLMSRTRDARQAAGELGVRYVLEGSVQRSATTLRVFARILDAPSYQQLWGEKFERSPDDLIAVEDEISGRIVAALRPNLPGAARRPQPTTSTKAYDIYLSGKYFLEKRPFEKTDTAISLFQKAIDLDPRFALAYAALGRAYSSKIFESDVNRELEEKASVAIEKALTYNPELAEAYVARAALLWTRSNGFPHERAAREVLKAIAINPNLIEAQELLGAIYLHIGLLDKSLEHLRKALLLDPTSVFSPPRIARVLWYQQRYAESLEHFQEIPGIRWRDERARVLYYLGRTDEALVLLKDTTWGMDADPGLGTRSRTDAASDLAAAFALLYAARGDTLLALQNITLARQKGAASSHFHHAAYTIACAYALMGKSATAIEWLRKIADDGYPCYPLFLTDPTLSSLHNQPDYLSLLARMKKEWEYWSSTLN